MENIASQTPICDGLFVGRPASMYVGGRPAEYHRMWYVYLRDVDAYGNATGGYGIIGPAHATKGEAAYWARSYHSEWGC